MSKIKHLKNVFTKHIYHTVAQAHSHRTVSYLTNSLQLTNEAYAKRFPALRE